MADGFVVLHCAAERCDHACGSAAETVLRQCVRESRHGVLVRAGCICGTLTCAGREAGAILAVQPCDRELVPSGPAVLVGPLVGDDDVAALRRCFTGGRFDIERLPPRLRARPRGAERAARN